MRFRDDERGQSVQIGAVLLFATLIIAFSSYQAFVVPQQNQAVEFDHNQQVHGELQDLRNAIVSMPGGASTTATSVTLGTTYPKPGGGTEPGAGEAARSGRRAPATNGSPSPFATRRRPARTGDVWDGSLRSYDTGVVNYDPSYNVYQGAPLSVYEHSVLYNEFRSGTIVTADQTVVDGRTISLVAVGGSLERTSTGATSVDVRPVSSSQETVLVEAPDDDSPVTINLTSRLPAARWESLLDGETHVRSVTEQPSDAPDGFRTVRITLDPGETYRLHHQGRCRHAGDERGAGLPDRRRGRRHFCPTGPKHHARRSGPRPVRQPRERRRSERQRRAGSVSPPPTPTRRGEPPSTTGHRAGNRGLST